MLVKSSSNFADASHYAPPLHARKSFVAHGVISRLARIFRAWDRYRRNRDALDHLEKLSDQHLADIGLTRRELTYDDLVTAAAKRDATPKMMNHSM